MLFKFVPYLLILVVVVDCQLITIKNPITFNTRLITTKPVPTPTFRPILTINPVIVQTLFPPGTGTTTAAPVTPAPTPEPVPPELQLLGPDGPLDPTVFDGAVYPGSLLRFRLLNLPATYFVNQLMRAFISGVECPMFFRDDVESR